LRLGAKPRRDELEVLADQITIGMSSNYPTRIAGEAGIGLRSKK